MPPVSTPDESHTLLAVFNRVGDLTLSAPLFRALARDTRLSLLTRPFGRELFAGQSWSERVYTLDYPNRGRSGLGKLLLGGHRRALGRELRRVDFDRVLIYATERGVIKRWLAELFPGRIEQMPRTQEPGIHASEWYRQAAVSTGCEMDAYERFPVLEIPAPAREQARARVAAIGERVVGVQMGSQRTHAVWPLIPRPHLKTLSVEQWTTLVRRLLDEGHADAVVFHGSRREQAAVRVVLGKLPPSARAHCHDFTDVSLSLLPAVLAQLEALVSVDTGPAHIAAAVGCPLLVFFGPTDPAVFAPRGSGSIELLVGSAPCQFCHDTPQYGICRDNICLNRLTDEHLWEAWLRLRASTRDQS